MIKVVEVSSDSNIGGAGKCILTFLKTYDRTEFDVMAIVPENSLLKPEIEDLKVKVFEAKHLAEKSLDFKAILRLRQMFKHIKPDIVHTHASMSARIAAWSLGIPVVYTRHSVFPQSKKLTTFPGKQINGFVNNMTATKIIAVAEAAKDNLTETGVKASKIKVILTPTEDVVFIKDGKVRNEIIYDIDLVNPENNNDDYSYDIKINSSLFDDCVSCNIKIDMFNAKVIYYNADGVIIKEGTIDDVPSINLTYDSFSAIN